MATTRPKRKLIIAFDCDDVLVPTSFKLLEAYDKRYGTSVEPKYLYDYHASWGVSNQKAIERVLTLHRHKVVTNAAPLSEAVAGIKRLAEAGHELHVITGRQDFQATDTLRQLDLHFMGAFTSVEFTSYLTKPSRSKAEVCKKLGVDIFIDDHIKHCNDVSRAGITTILFGNYPWNSERAGVDASVRYCPAMIDVCAEVEYATQR